MGRHFLLELHRVANDNDCYSSRQGCQEVWCSECDTSPLVFLRARSTSKLRMLVVPSQIGSTFIAWRTRQWLKVNGWLWQSCAQQSTLFCQGLRWREHLPVRLCIVLASQCLRYSPGHQSSPTPPMPPLLPAHKDKKVGYRESRKMQKLTLMWRACE